MMIPMSYFTLFVVIALCIGSIYYLLRTLRRDRQFLSLVGLFCMAIGFFLLLLDLALIAFSIGVRYIPDYLVFNRLVADSGFAGRWILTVYVFISTAVAIAIYLLVRNLIAMFNKPKDGTEF